MMGSLSNSSEVERSLGMQLYDQIDAGRGRPGRSRPIQDDHRHSAPTEALYEVRDERE